eukprot:217016_1
MAGLFSEANKKHFVNEHDDIIYALGHFYVTLKYKDLKEELMNNAISTIASYKWNILMQKALHFLQTDHVKSLCCTHNASGFKYYGISGNTPITLIHILAIMVYCNETQLQSKFSGTYRRISKTESHNSLIERHRNFANMGKLLRECVDCFGERYNDDGNGIHQPTQNYSTILFHGMSIESQFCSIHANIKGPFSTTTDYAVAVKFCANSGMILELCLDAQWDFPKHCHSTSLFNCKYVSDFPYEKEVFFIGGFSNFFFSALTTWNGCNYWMYIRALNRLMQQLNQFFIFAGDMASTPYDPYEYAVNRTHDAIDKKTKIIIEQIAYRMLFDELHRHYPNDTDYIEYASMPSYVRGLMQRHFATVVRLDPIQRGNDIIKALLFYDFGMLNLDLVTTIFPNVIDVRLTDYVENAELIENKDTFISVMDTIMTKKDLRLKRIIMKLLGTSANLVEEQISQYRHAFAALNWSIFRESHAPYLHIVSNGMKSAYKKENQELFSDETIYRYLI